MWVLRYDNPKVPPVGTGRVFNAFTMEERCLGLQLSGATYYEDLEECESVKRYVQGFGEHKKRRDISDEDGGWWDHGQWD